MIFNGSVQELVDQILPVGLDELYPSQVSLFYYDSRGRKEALEVYFFPDNGSLNPDEDGFLGFSALCEYASADAPLPFLTQQQFWDVWAPSASGNLISFTETQYDEFVYSLPVSLVVQTENYSTQNPQELPDLTSSIVTYSYSSNGFLSSQSTVSNSTDAAESIELRNYTREATGRLSAIGSADGVSSAQYIYTPAGAAERIEIYSDAQLQRVVS